MASSSGSDSGLTPQVTGAFLPSIEARDRAESRSEWLQRLLAVGQQDAAEEWDYRGAVNKTLPIIRSFLSLFFFIHTSKQSTKPLLKVALAPMVRVGTLPMRLLARHYGCKMLYSEELIDKKIAKLTRYVDPATGLVHFGVSSSTNSNNSSSISTSSSSSSSSSCDWDLGSSVLTTYPGERLVVQLGTCNGADAVRAAEVVARDARAIDINMGCPKLFSLQAGMGSALLGKPETVRDIVSSLRRALPATVPVTAKIRMLPEVRQTLQLCQILQQCGVAAIAVHARWTPDRPRHKALPEEQVRKCSV